MPALAHLGIGFAIKRFAPQIPLWALLISSMLLDGLSFIFLYALWITHGLFMSIVWSILALGMTTLITIGLNLKKGKDKKAYSELLSIGFIIGLVVFSHWILDFIGWPMSVIDPASTGVPILFDDAVNIGLGVYSTWFGALLMDLGMFAVGILVFIHYQLKIKKYKIKQ
ncbi:MAG: hypothetical protein ACFFD1_10630 [Candidatus Thorarchaeota archaeon]